MESELYRSLFQEEIAESKHEWLTEGLKEGDTGRTKKTIIRILVRRLGYLDESARLRIEAEGSQEVLDTWYEEALGAVDEASAQRLLAQIRKAPPVAR